MHKCTWDLWPLNIKELSVEQSKKSGRTPDFLSMSLEKSKKPDECETRALVLIWSGGCFIRGLHKHLKRVKSGHEHASLSHFGSELIIHCSSERIKMPARNLVQLRIGSKDWVSIDCWHLWEQSLQIKTKIWNLQLTKCLTWTNVQILSSKGRLWDDDIRKINRFSQWPSPVNSEWQTFKIKFSHKRIHALEQLLLALCDIQSSLWLVCWREKSSTGKSMKSAADEKERNVVEREAADISFLFFDNLQTVGLYLAQMCWHF